MLYMEVVEWRERTRKGREEKEGKLPLFGYNQNKGTIILLFELKQRE